jgi:dTDP-4-amino-4,6-dideoxygalactose transaminase
MTMLSDNGIAFSLPDLGAEEEEAVLRVLRSGWITTGDEAAALEAELGDYLEGAQVAVLSSCTVALESVLAYLHLPPGAGVAVPDWTFVSTGLSAARLRLTPVLVDVDPGTLNMSAESLADVLDHGPPVAAVMPVHFAGVPVDRAVYDLCRQRGIPIVNDAAHAFGARDERGRLSGRGVVADCFSFYATKNLTCGEGGAIATRDPDLRDFVSSYRQHGLDRNAWKRYRLGSSANYRLEHPGIKGNLPDLLAAVARVQLTKFPRMQARRAELVATYLQELDGVDGVRPLASMGATGSAHHLFVVVLDRGVDRGAIAEGMAARGVGTSVHFTPLHEHDWFARNAMVPRSGLPVGRELGSRVMSLPLHSRMDPADVAHVCRALAGVMPLGTTTAVR